MDMLTFVNHHLSLKLHQKTSGIYALYCKADNKIYIGQSNFIKRRFDHHRKHLQSKRHVNDKLQFTWNKYGAESFIFFVLEHCSRENLYIREKAYVDMFDRESLLNLAPMLNPLRGQERPFFMDESWRQKVSKGLIGKKFTEEHKQRMKMALRRVYLKYTLILFDDLTTLKLRDSTFFVKIPWARYEGIETMEVGKPLKLIVSTDIVGIQTYESSKNIKKIFYKGDLVCKKEKQIVLNEDDLRLYVDL